MDMNKRIPCKRCSGRGFINWTFSEGNTGTATSYICPDCNGSGDIVVPMTNADRIRAMSDEELAVVIMCPYDMEHPLCIQSPKCVDCCLKWLQHPAEKEQL